MLTNLKHAFSFAGFSFPKHAWRLPQGPMAKRIERMRNPVYGGCMSTDGRVYYEIGD